MFDAAVYPSTDSPRKIYIPSQIPDNEVEPETEISDTSDQEFRTPSPGSLQYPSPSRPSTPVQSPSILEVPSAPRKQNKWDSLPKRDPSIRERRMPKRFIQEEDKEKSGH
ncbi:hypothetical protein C0993_004693, partial [Termitomyces sp. T159_Od127]